MNCFTDTSAFYAVLDGDDENNPQAGRLWKEIIENEFRLVTSNYVIVETVALLQSRIGMEAVRVFHEDILPLVHIHFVTPEIHSRGVSALLTASRRKLSLVDCVSFELIRDLKPDAVFAFDSHFADQGFTILA